MSKEQEEKNKEVFDFIRSAIAYATNNKYTVSDMFAKGYIMDVSGKPFKDLGSEDANLESLMNYIAEGKGKVVLTEPLAKGESYTYNDYKIRRFGYLNKDAEGNINFHPDTPTRDNDYTRLYGQMFEPADPTPEMASFVKNLRETLKREADLDLDNKADRLRLRVYTEYTDEKGQRAFEEVDPFISTSFDTGHQQCFHKMKINNSIDFYHKKELTEADMKLMNVYERDTNRMIYQMENKKSIIDDIHMWNYIIQAAKDGRLMATKPNEPIQDSHPVVLNADNSIQVLPSEKDASPEQKQTAPYTLGTRLVKESVYVKDETRGREYAAELAEYKTKVFTKKFTNLRGFNMDSFTNDFTKEAAGKGISKEQFLKEIDALNFQTSNNAQEFFNAEMDNNDVDYHISKPSVFSAGSRERLSKQARHNYFAAQYDMLNVGSVLVRHCEQTKELTYDQIAALDYSRDSMKFLLESDVSPEGIQRNIERVKKFNGIGCKTEDEKQRAYADVFNDALRRLNNYDYVKPFSYTDEELVQHFDEVNKHFFILSTALAESNDAMSKNPDNPYIDQEELKKMLNIERTYMMGNMVLYNRMRTIANSYYSKIKIEDVLNLDPSVSDGVKDAFFDGADPEFARMMKMNSDTLSGYSGFQSKYIEGVMIANNGIDLRGNGKSYPMTYFDQQGNKINSLELRGHLMNGEAVYAAFKGDAASLTAFKADKGQLIPKEDTVTLENPANAAVQESIGKQLFAEKEKMHEEHNIDEMLDHYLFTYQRTHTRTGIELVSEAMKKNIGESELVDKVTQYYLGEPKYSPKQIYDLMGLDAGENGSKLPTEKEIQARRYLTIQANAAIISSQYHEAQNMESVKNYSDQMDKSHLGLNARRFRFIMLDMCGETEDPKKYNKELFDKFMSADTNEKAKIFKEVLERHMKYMDDKNFFGKTYTDEQLVENFDTLEQPLVAFGMELKDFWTDLNNIGITKDEKFFDKEFLNKVDSYMDKATAYNNYYMNRMEQISNEYYQYCPNITTDNASGLMTTKDRSLTALGALELSSRMTQELSFGEYIRIFTAPEDNAKLQCIVDEKGNVYDNLIAKEPEYGKAAMNGQKLTFIYAGEPHIREFKFSANPFPPVGTELQPELDMIDRKDALYEFKTKLVDNDKTLNETQKILAKNTIDAKDELCHTLEEEDGPDKEAEIREDMTELFTCAVMERFAKTAGNDPAKLEKALSDKMRREVAEGLQKSETFKLALDKLPRDRMGIQKMSGKDIYGILDTIEKERKAGVEAKNKEVEQVLSSKDAVLDDSMLSKAYAAADFRKSRDFFSKDFNDSDENILKDQVKDLESGELFSNMSRPVQTLAMAMMMSQGVSPSDALDVKAGASSRVQCTKAAIEAIKGNDMKYIRDTMFRGMRALNEYIEKSTAALGDEVTVYTFAKPENNTLLTSTDFLADMKDGFKAAEDNAPIEDQKFFNEKIKPELDKADEIKDNFDNLKNEIRSKVNAFRAEKKAAEVEKKAAKEKEVKKEDKGAQL